MKIRTPEISDAPSVAAVHNSSSERAYRDILPRDVIEDAARKRLAQWDARFRNSPDAGRTLVCEVEGAIAGFSLFGPCRDDWADPKVNGEVWALYIAPEFWGHGCGYALWQATAERLLESGFADMFVWALENNERARRFYVRAGGILQPDKIKDLERNGKRFPEVCYWQSLARA